MYKRRRYQRKKRRFYIPRGYGRVGGAYDRYQLAREKKYHEDSGTTVFTSPSWTIWDESLINVPAGTGPTQRIGERIYVHSLHFKGWYRTFFQSGDVHSSNVVRVQVVQDMQANGVQAGAGEHMEGGVDVNSFRDLNKVGRFKVLKDFCFTQKYSADFQTNSTDVATKVAFNLKFRRPIVINFNGTTGGIAEVMSNNIYIVACHSSTAWTVDPAMVGQSRIRFTD